MKEVVVASLIGYLFGCFQTSIFVGRYFKKIDIREHGSQNAGASNTTVVLGLPYGLVTALFDILKSVIAVLVVRRLYPTDQALLVIAGIASIIGHIFPVFFGFRGGKGVASLIGTVLALDPWSGLIIVLASIAAALISDLVVVGSTTLYVLFAGLMFFSGYPASSKWLSLFLLVVALIKHRDNYQRIIEGGELKIRASFNGEGKEHRV